MPRSQGAEPDEWFANSVAEVARFGRVVQMRSRLTDVEAAELRVAMLESLPSMAERLEQLHAELCSVLSSVDSRELLMQFAIPYLFVDADTWIESASDQLPAHVEYLALQVLGLNQGDGNADPERIQAALHEVEPLIHELFELATRRLWAETMLSPDSDLTEAERLARARMLSESITVRNSLYEQHAIHVATELLGHFDDQLLHAVGFTVGDALKVYKSLGDLRFVPFNERFEAAMTDYVGLLTEAKRVRRGKPLLSSDNADFIRRLASLSPSEARKRLRDAAVVFSFADSKRTSAVVPERTAEASGVEVDRVVAFLNFFTADPADFDARHHRFPCPTHPLQRGPLLRDGDAWLLPVPGDLLFALVPAIEAVLQEHDEIWKKYSAWRGRFLEEESGRLLGEALPGSKVTTRTPWSDGIKSGELDVIVAYGDSTLVVQCKAGRVPAAARRGGVARMHVAAGRLVGEAVSQHNSLRDALDQKTAEELGLVVHAEALSAPLRLEVVVTLDDFSTLSTDAYALRQFGTLTPDDPIPWIVPLGDLYVVRDLLNGTELIHYLTRRSKLNHLGRVSAHDELDWVGHYLSDGLFFDELFADDNAPSFFRLNSFTDSIDQWYFAREGHRTVPTDRPRVVRPPLISALIRRLEHERPRRFVIAGCLLRDLGEDTAQALENDLIEAQQRATQQGAASVTIVLPPYGISIGYELADPGRLLEHLRWFAQRDRTEGDRPLWLAIGQAPGLPMQVLARGDPNIAEAVRNALMVPFAHTPTEDRAPEMLA